MRALLAIVLLAAAGCRTAADFRALPPDETRLYPGDLERFEQRVLARHGRSSSLLSSLVIRDVSTERDEVDLWGTTHDALGAEHQAFLITAQQHDDATLSIEVRASGALFGNGLRDRAWQIVEDCIDRPSAAR